LIFEILVLILAVASGWPRIMVQDKDSTIFFAEDFL